MLPYFFAGLGLFLLGLSRSRKIYLPVLRESRGYRYFYTWRQLYYSNHMFFAARQLMDLGHQLSR